MLTFDAKHMRSTAPPWSVGWRDASTFMGFCSAHDTSTFVVLDDRPFEATPEQTFLLGYRAVCLELHDKIGAVKSNPSLRDVVDRGLPFGDQVRAQKLIRTLEAGASKGLRSMRRAKERMDVELLSHTHGAWNRLTIWCSGTPAIAAAAALTPNRDLDGNDLQVLHDVQHDDLEGLLLGTAMTPSGFAYVFTWRTGERAPERFVESMLSRPRERLASLVVQVAFAFAGNTYFSSSWWARLKPIQQQHLARLGSSSNPYYEDLTWIAARLGDWDVLRVTE